MSNLQQPSSSDGSTSSNVLDCDSVLELLTALLPASNITTGSQPQENSSPTAILSSPYEGLAALAHAMMTAVGFRLVGLGEDDSLEPGRVNIEDIKRANILPERWNTSKESYSFRYTHSHSQLTYLIKCMRLAGKCVIHGTTIETSKICSLELEVNSFTSPSYFPYTTATDLSKDPLWNAFISRSRINDLISQFKLKIVQVLIPGLSKPGYQEERTAVGNTSTTTAQTGGNSSSSTSGGENNRGGFGPEYLPDDPSTFPGMGGIPHPGRPGFVPRPPIFGDPFSADDTDHSFGGGHNPFSIGHNDLDPFGGRLGGGLGGGFGGGIGGSSGGGMVVGPNHPMFRRPPGGVGGVGGGGIYGGPQPLPRGSVPPGARFDPIGPFGPGGGQAPGAGSAHGDYRGQGRGAGRGASFPGEPDNDDAPPPGYMDMFM
ncbi:hypothetical protein BGZ76_001438 [Entomortierella beljakovae]|nr:hypothetical protein BGZ76_001438 [Entomortierella beljakovae]